MDLHAIDIAIIAAFQSIIALSAEQSVTAAFATQRVIPGPPQKGISTTLPGQSVIAAAPVQSPGFPDFQGKPVVFSIPFLSGFDKNFHRAGGCWGRGGGWQRSSSAAGTAGIQLDRCRSPREVLRDHDGVVIYAVMQVFPGLDPDPDHSHVRI